MIRTSCSARVTQCPIPRLGHSGVGDGFKPKRDGCQSGKTRDEPVNRQRRVREGGHSAGYLLLEVLLALAVLSLVVGMIFKIIQTTLKVTADIDFLQTQQRKVDGIYELLRRNFDSMPRTCTFQTRRINGSLELIFRSAPFNFSWARAGANFGTVVIANRSQPDGRWALSVLQESGNSSGRDTYLAGGNEKKAEWFSLMNDVEQLNWRFFDETTGKWMPDWPNIGAKPNLVELTFRLAGRNHTERCVFRWPIAQTGS
jgi:hypothetical protein